MALILAILGTASTAQAKRLGPEQRLAKVLDGRVAGEPQDCIYLPNVRSTRIIQDTAIVYDTGRVLWVNRPEVGASSLDEDDILVSKLHGSGSQLCSIDVVRLHDRSNFIFSGFVGLGEFVPYRKAQAAN